MTNYDDIFEYEDESVRLDFKGAQYPKAYHDDLLKDLIAFANADFEGDRFIIIGVISDAENEKVFKGIDKAELIDSAVYQQLVRENVEPDINLEYFLYSYGGKDFGVFRIFDCSDKPYLMKKDHGKLKQGDGWIRKGTHQPRLNRRDLDLIAEKKHVAKGFSGDVTCCFSDSGLEEINIVSLGDVRYPSELAADAIRNIIQRKRDSAELDSLTDTTPQRISISSLLRLSDPYECYLTKSIDQLEKELGRINEEYSIDDNYFLFEENGDKINFTVINRGSQYIEDAVIKIIFPKLDGLLIADQVYEKKPRSTLEIMNSLTSSSELLYTHHSPSYPIIDFFEESIEIQQNLGQIRHNIPTDRIFEIPLRILIKKNLVGQTIPVKCLIYGKNLPTPIERILSIHVVEN